MTQPFPALQGLFGNKPKPYLMAHRGNRALCPENTLASFRQAIKDGADIMETDLHLSADEVFICIHDSTVDRTTNGVGQVANMSLDEIKSLKALGSQGKITDETVPTLAELAQMLPAQVALALELKTDRFLEAKVCRRLGDELACWGVLERTIALSFSLARLQTLKRTLPDFSIGWITMSRLVPDEQVDMVGPFWPLIFINPFYVSRAHRRGMLVCPLDPAPEARIGLYMKMKCDALISDNPTKTKEAIKRWAHKNS